MLHVESMDVKRIFFCHSTCANNTLKPTNFPNVVSHARQSGSTRMRSMLILVLISTPQLGMCDQFCKSNTVFYQQNNYLPFTGSILGADSQVTHNLCEDHSGSVWNPGTTLKGQMKVNHYHFNICKCIFLFGQRSSI